MNRIEGEEEENNNKSIQKFAFMKISSSMKISFFRSFSRLPCSRRKIKTAFGRKIYLQLSLKDFRIICSSRSACKTNFNFQLPQPQTVAWKNEEKKKRKIESELKGKMGLKTIRDNLNLLLEVNAEQKRTTVIRKSESGRNIKEHSRFDYNFTG